jgi:hypothetical protein
MFFYLKEFFATFLCLEFVFAIFWGKGSRHKSACKMLRTLTTGVNLIKKKKNIFLLPRTSSGKIYVLILLFFEQMFKSKNGFI